MATGKSDRTKEESQIQMLRSARNQIKRYEKLIAAHPNDKHKDVWIKMLDKYEAQLR